MNISDYGPQEPLEGRMQEYDATLWSMAGEQPDEEWRYGSDPYQSISLFRPAQDRGILVVAIHGGGWTNGYKEYMHGLARGFREAGMAFASIGYRLAPAHRFPLQLLDCELALASLAERVTPAQRQQVVLTGHSAGGHLATLLALHPVRWGRLKLRAALPLSGVYDFTASGGMSRRPRFLPDDEAGRLASPLHQATAAALPILLARAQHDMPHLVAQQDAFEQRLRQLGVPVQTLVLPADDHFTVLYRAPGAWTHEAVAFIEWVTEAGAAAAPARPS